MLHLDSASRLSAFNRLNAVPSLDPQTSRNPTPEALEPTFLPKAGVVSVLSDRRAAVKSKLESKAGAMAGIDVDAVLALGAEVKEMVPGVYLLRFDDAERMCETFLRFQEHYESPEFKNRLFNLDEYKAWYAQENGSFSYYTDWGGFNIPSRVLTPFYDGGFDPLSWREQLMVQAFENVKGDFYVIGTAGDGALKHEVAHGLFSTNAAYNREVMEVLAPLDLEPIMLALAEIGYDRSVLEDEAHAYLRDGGDSLSDPELDNPVDLAPYRDAIPKLQAIFKRYFAAGQSALKAA